MSRKNRQRRLPRRLRKLSRGCKPDGTPAEANASTDETPLRIGLASIEIDYIPSFIQDAIEQKLRDRGVIDH